MRSSWYNLATSTTAQRTGTVLLLHVDPTRPDPDVIARAADALARGGLVAFPTETVYGLGAHALDAGAVRRIFEAKGRPTYNPVIVHVADARQARPLVRDWPDTAERLAARFWPGPLTMVLPRAEVVPPIVSAGLGSVAVRVPAHPVALALLRSSGLPIAAPSANRSSRVSPTTAAHVAASLGDRVDVIVDGGPSVVGIESTVVDLTGERPRILRPGTIDAAALRAALDVEVDDAEGPAGGPAERRAPARARRGEATAPRPSPGMLERHYAPAAEVRLFDPDPAEARALHEAVRRAIEANRRVAAMARTVHFPEGVHVVAMPTTAADYARVLYASLHAVDDSGFDLLFIERPPATPEWAAVRDRLMRASRR